MKYDFPKNFWWGAATSGPQSEGRFNKAHQNIFDYWYDKDPSAFFDGVGPNVASNFYNSHAEDIDLMKQVGLNSVRTSIQWSRLIKDFATGELDEDAVRFYNQVIDEFLAAGIRPVMNQVKDWMTFNEPMVIPEGGYLYKFHYPLKVDGKAAIQIVYNLNLASAKAIKAYHEYCQAEGIEDGRIGIVINLTPAYPRSDSPEDKAAARFAELFKNNAFLDPAVKGYFPQELVDTLTEDGVIWQTEPGDAEIIKENTVDYLGVNYYHPFRAKARETAFDDSQGWLPEKHFEEYEWPEARINVHRGWEIYPRAIYDIAINVRDNYGNIPWFISENGMGVEGESKFRNEEGFIEDDYRIEFIQEHLQWLHKAIQENSNCFGYHLWTPIDCWSWMNAYKNRYGLIAVDDLATQKKIIKKSGYWFKALSDNNGFSTVD